MVCKIFAFTKLGIENYARFKGIMEVSRVKIKMKEVTLIIVVNEDYKKLVKRVGKIDYSYEERVQRKNVIL